MKTKRLKLITLCIAFLAFAFILHAQTAEDILKKHDAVTFAPKDQQTELTISVIDKKGNTKTRKASMLQKGRNMRLTRFTYPASQAGIGFLSLPNDIMYIYLPAYGKERRIASHVKNQTFAGTDFSYDDMESVPLSDKYNAKLIKTTDTYYYLELIPINPKKSEYSKAILVINKSNYTGKQTTYYNKGGVMFKQLKSVVEKQGQYWVAISAEMNNLLKNHKTTMNITKAVFDSGLSDDEFTVRKLVQ
ncbi:MAG: outer membrane lipoprotein-sorting protein [Bacteroidetes bacterium]|jgi:outer membrane lipoprotein-sorting protein|nr:outer membrane lipoprotein-sorting protein [Bacteroidota bacterium]MBT5529666.1 outer membrane lipoprotein-sorting protein [Cytophagia bacterium]MBT3423167.1 outer membrane lipoprotein-sorting protein [Bacteroidota bacterium]MBT3800979.1 outer membrane lipoprotein-sorting protein [Bacteroidota bacterium]MBT3935381.1 outer membrane lipoprotein-sorting protein [Bacteroidota bacterium]